MTPDQFRKIALSFDGAVESSHMKHPDFRVAGKIFTTLGYPDDDWAMVKLTPEQQRSFVATDPKVFQPCNGAWGRSGCTNILLSVAKVKTARAALEIAVENLTGSSPKSK